MGQKVNLIGLCFGVNCMWEFCWYVGVGEYVKLLYEDFKICDMLKKCFKNVSVFKIVIECLYKKCCVMIYIVCLGVVIGKKGFDIEVLCCEFFCMVDGEVFLNFVEVCKLEVDVNLVVELIVQQLECCVVFCCVMKCLFQFVMCMGVKGCKIFCGGCFGGVEIVCFEQYQEGFVLLYMLCVDIDYGIVEVKIVMGIIGIKVWIYKGEIMEYDLMVQECCFQELGEQCVCLGC